MDACAGRNGVEPKKAMLDPIYINTVRLLLDVVPDIFADQLLAMKGGTAINLFTRDAPKVVGRH